MDDGSPDGTQEIVKQLQHLYGEDRIVSTVDELGLEYVVFFFCMLFFLCLVELCVRLCYDAASKSSSQEAWFGFVSVTPIIFYYFALQEVHDY